ncbi:MAG: hypothetical protein AAF677_06575 [Pseudomonadota bacterium]
MATLQSLYLRGPDALDPFGGGPGFDHFGRPRRHSCRFQAGMSQPPLTHQMANLLESPAVQKIGFRFGHVIVTPTDFRDVATALRAGRVTVKIDPAELKRHDAIAMYEHTGNVVTVASAGILGTIEGRSTVVHEAAHAVADNRGRGTAVRHDECAAYICEAWYYLETTTVTQAVIDKSSCTEAIFEIAKALRNRAKSEKPPRASNDEINRGRREMARYGYQNGHYSYNGI